MSVFDVSNFKDVLNMLSFIERGDLYEKTFPEIGCSLKVDFRARKLIYPEAIKGRERNDGFDIKENFVVFECVNRLLEKGYRPEHIELEKVWQLGHEQKGGRADICISDIDGSMLVIIECKTYGKEFDKYYKKTITDGDQLFSYWQQERATKWLVLYASGLSNNEITYKAPTINCTDYKSVLESAKKDKTILSYQKAYTKDQLFEVWKETYACKFYDDLVFSINSRAYKIGVKPLLKKDLRDFTPEDKIVNKFEEILRHNNVSDKENAFNRLVALFICKLVDESTKGEDDEVEFQYKQGTDDYETLQDRLQRLHTKGMLEFMHEKIFYVSNDYPEWLFSTYTGQHRQKAIDDLREKIRILKYYSNNDFSFKDVHNEELFYQNGKILVEVVQLFEQFRIVYPSKHQFLGDLFEQLLNKGFKQNEGQFFTPMPITRFIWDCLPVERMTHSEEGFSYPKVIDYACGAGHFLTEAVETINAFVDNGGDNSWVRDHIYGIEKDYRLARVSKISLFMNGAGGGNIIFGDGLENAPDKQIESNSFDVLVANPPYSVKDFKQHLQLKNNSFELLNFIGNAGSEIEVLFVERIAQLLKPKGIAAVILPVTILSKNTASYTGARERILKNFYIRGIVQLGNGAFGKTGTDTVVMFLEKYDEPPKKKDLISDSINAILEGKELSDWKDIVIFETYLSQIEVDKAEYLPFIMEALNPSELSKTEYFKMYVNSFDNSSEIKNLRKSKSFKKKTIDWQNAELKKRFYNYAKSIEFEKLYYYALTFEQQTVIISAPTKTGARKKFLGYEYKNSKGFEGIHILSPGGELYDDKNRTASGTLASAIKLSYSDIIPAFNEENKKYAGIANTCDMLNFHRPIFDKTLKLSAAKKIEIQSKYPMIRLGKIAPFSSERINIREIELKDYITTDNMIKDRGGVIEYSGTPEIDSVIRYEKGDILVSNIRPYLKKIWLADKSGGCSPDVLVFHVIDANVKTGYLHCVLSQDIYFDYMMANHQGVKMPRGDKSMIPFFKVPVPPTDVQDQIITECEQIDIQYGTIKAQRQNYLREIELLFDKLDLQQKLPNRYSLADKSKFNIMIGQRILETELELNGTVPVFSANVYEPFGYVNKLLVEDFRSDSIIWGIDGDWMVNYYVKEQPFYPTDHCGVLRVLTNEVNPRYMAHILETEGKKMKFSRSYRASIDRVEEITFTVPSIEDQNTTMKKVLELEQKASNAEKQLSDIASKKAEVLKKYL